MRKKSLSWSIMAGAVAGALALSGCTASGGANEEEQSLRFGFSAEAPALIAGADQGASGMMMNSLLHRGLVSYDEKGEVEAALASEFEQVAANEYRFVLREGLTFHDGSPVTLDNVKATYKYYADPGNGAAFATAFANIASIDEGADGEFTIKLKQNNGVFLQNLADPNTPILPDAALNPSVDNVIGAGPFTLGEKVTGVGLTVERFDGYYESGEVALDEIEITYYKDSAARVNSLLGGDVDIIDYVPWESFSQIEDASGFSITAKDGPGNQMHFNTDVAPWDNPKVRQAVAYAINREAIVDSVFYGNAKPIYGVAVEEGSEYDIPEATNMWEYNPDKAKQLLAEAGYPQGFSSTMLGTSQYEFSQDIVISVQSDLKKIGIDLELELTDFPTMVEKLGACDYETNGGGAVVSPVTDPSYLLSYVTGKFIYHPCGYENDELTGLLQSGLAAATEEERLADYKEAFRIIKEEAPFVQLAQRGQAFGVSDRVKGFEMLQGFKVSMSGLNFTNVQVQ